jgi:hypothetical protein
LPCGGGGVGGVVFDGDVGEVVWADGVEVELLAWDVAGVVAANDFFVAAKQFEVALAGACERDVEVGLDEDAIVPAVVEFRPQQEHAVKQEDRVMGCGAKGFLDGLIDAEVEDGFAVDPRASRPERFEDMFADRLVVERIVIVALDGVRPLSDAVFSRVVKAINRRPHDRPAECFHVFGEFIGEGSLAGSARAIDGDAGRVVTLEGNDFRGDLLEEFGSWHGRVFRVWGGGWNRVVGGVIPLFASLRGGFFLWFRGFGVVGLWFSGAEVQEVCGGFELDLAELRFR